MTKKIEPKRHAQKRNKPVKSSKETIQQLDKLQDELKPSIHFDYTDQIASVMENHSQHCEDAGRNLYLRQYMWDLFAVSQIMHIRDTLVNKNTDYPYDKYTSMEPNELIEKAKDILNNILTGQHDKRLVSEEQEDISVYEYTLSQKLGAILNACYVASIAFIKLRDYEKLFVLPDNTIKE